jgi:hypothetical protein
MKIITSNLSCSGDMYDTYKDTTFVWTSTARKRQQQRAGGENEEQQGQT